MPGQPLRTLACAQTERCRTPHPHAPIPEPALAPTPSGTRLLRSPRVCVHDLEVCAPDSRPLRGWPPQSRSRLLAHPAGRTALWVRPHPPAAYGRTPRVPPDSRPAGLAPQGCERATVSEADRLAPINAPESPPASRPSWCGRLRGDGSIKEAASVHWLCPEQPKRESTVLDAHRPGGAAGQNAFSTAQPYRHPLGRIGPLPPA